jgi:hypothetical protein
MKKSLYACVGARAISFPEIIQIEYHCLDDQDRPTGEVYLGPSVTWDEAKTRFWVDIDCAAECEKYFCEGITAKLRNTMVTGTFYEKGDEVRVDAVREGSVTSDLPSFASELPKHWKCPSCSTVYGLFVSGNYTIPIEFSGDADPCVIAINRALRAECALSHPSYHLFSVNGTDAVMLNR